jgi:hypothetical protein
MSRMGRSMSRKEEVRLGGEEYIQEERKYVEKGR